MASGLRFEQIGDCPLWVTTRSCSIFRGRGSAYIVDDIGQPDPHDGPCDTDSSDEESRLRFLVGKDMLDARPDHRLPCIRSLDMPGHRFEMRLFPVNLRNKAVVFHEVFIGF